MPLGCSNRSLRFEHVARLRFRKRGVAAAALEGPDLFLGNLVLCERTSFSCGGLRGKLGRSRCAAVDSRMRCSERGASAVREQPFAGPDRGTRAAGREGGPRAAIKTIFGSYIFRDRRDRAAWLGITPRGGVGPVTCQSGTGRRFVPAASLLPRAASLYYY